jgi:hypothetical protein
MFPDLVKKILPIADSLGMVGPGWVYVGVDAWMGELTSISDATDPAFVEGILGLEPYLNTDSDGWQQMKTNWLSLGATPGETYADLAVSPAYGEFDDENPWPGYNYDAVWIVAKALDALITAEGIAAVQDPDKMTAAIRATTLPDGATGSIQFTSEGNMIGEPRASEASAGRLAAAAHQRMTPTTDGAPSRAGEASAKRS